VFLLSPDIEHPPEMVSINGIGHGQSEGGGPPQQTPEKKFPEIPPPLPDETQHYNRAEKGLDLRKFQL